MNRTFQIFGEQVEDGFIPHDRDEVRQTLLDLEGALHTLGGVVTISAVRQQVADESYVTTGMLIRYDSFTPAARQPAYEEPDAATDDPPAVEIVTSDAT